MKVRNYRAFWVLLAITIVSIPGFNYTWYDLLDNSFPKRNGKSLLGSPFDFPDVWQTVSWNASMLFIVPAILVITLTTNEFSYKTHRQNIIDGWSRGQFISVKLMEVLLFSAFTTLIVFLTALIFGLAGTKMPAGASIWHESRFVFFYFVQMLSYSMIAFVISLLIKRAGLAMGIWFIYLIIEQVIVGLGRHKYKVDWINYLPEEVTDRLIPQPYVKAVIAQGGDPAKWESLIPVFLAVAAAYLLVYCLLSSRYFLKSDL
jgi:ABC-type transport system involved in multi-copper enzyme maturation permease subunit